MHLTLNGQEGPATAAVLNDLMTRFVEQTSIAKKLALTTQEHVLDSLVKVANAQLQADERALQTMKVKTITLPRDNLPVAPGLQAETNPTAYNSDLMPAGKRQGADRRTMR